MAAVHNRLQRHRSHRASGGRPAIKRNSHSEKGSFDLDRSWEDHLHYENHGWGSSSARNHSFDLPDSTAVTTSTSSATRETTYNTGLGLGDSSDSTFGMSRSSYSNTASIAVPRTTKYPVHGRSVSGTSHVSITTSSAGHRPGSFVHPFQQTPRTSSPPLFIAPSSPLERSPSLREYSPTIAENDEIYSSSTPINRSYSVGARASLDFTPSGTYHSTRTPYAVLTPTRPDAALSSNMEALDTPSPITPIKSSFTSSSAPKRPSLDMPFRLRSRSAEVDTFTQSERLREARRRFEEKQRVKDEKYARAQVEKKDREATKEAVKFEKAQAQLKKAASSTGSGRNSNEMCAASALATTVRRGTGASSEAEKQSPDLAFASSSYENTTAGAEPTSDVDSCMDTNAPPRRIYSAKKRTQSTWTAFILWIRTRLFKIGRR
ncbi:hypothetical protein TD95_004185 [Thielaviopsis punctulata]|uniref:Uncharacterized protein n=1 Tax=Thielaviopsis punctulata TaxID=72032 RepID=A0A0F4ZEP2_9PEZI|nr:hypothetical protein TD95_004185 [Thielaviopsis punctulata]